MWCFRALDTGFPADRVVLLFAPHAEHPRNYSVEVVSMENETCIHIRLSQSLKQGADEAFHSLNMVPASGVRLLLTLFVASRLPFPRDCQTSLNSCFNACFEMFCRNPVKKWQRLPAAATRQDAASTI